MMFSLYFKTARCIYMQHLYNSVFCNVIEKKYMSFQHFLTSLASFCAKLSNEQIKLINNIFITIGWKM